MESEKGKGSTFWFSAVFDRVKTPRSREFHPPADLRELKVLIVDDNEVARDVLRSALESFGFEVHEASGGAAGIRELERAREAGDRAYDLVLLDWRMPAVDGIEAATEIRQHADLESIPRIVMVTAYGREQVQLQAQDARLEGFLVKPFSPSTLFDTIMGAFGHVSRTHDDFNPFGVDSIPGLEAIRGAHLLLVEDKELNQEVACGILEGEGFRVSVVGDGRQALDKVLAEGDNFDLVIMDLQMPEMDGYTASREIRKRKEFDWLPILAMTADALDGVEERVLAAGMNGYATKPIHPPKLFAELVRWIDPARIVGGATTHRTPGESEEIPDLPGIDVSGGLSRLQGRTGLYRSVLKKFALRQADTGYRLQAQLEAGDLEEARRLTHSLKGLSGNISARALFRATSELDDILKLQEAPPEAMVEAVLRELEVVIEGLKEAFFEEKSAPEGEVWPVDEEKLATLLEQLQELLKDDDTGATAVLDEVRQCLPAGLADGELKALGLAVEEYEFEAALENLQKLVGKLEGAK